MRIFQPLSVLAGVAAALLLVANGSFHGVATNLVAWWAALLAMAVFAALATRSPRSIDAVFVPVVFALPAIHFMWPLFGTSHHLLLVDAGDFNQYLGLGSWFTSHPISEAPHLGADYNTLQFNLWDHVSNFLRPGGLFLLALFGSLASREVADIYSPFLAFGLGLQALGVYLFALAAFEKLPAHACATIAVLFAISPAATWPAYASFLPQTVGMAFLLATTGTVVAVIQQGPGRNRRDVVALGAALALVTFATWSVYPESTPLGAIVCGFFALASYRQIALLRVRRLAIFFAAAVALAIIISPDSFLWAARGLWVQLGSFAHGGQQVTTIYTLVAAVLAASQLPLVDTLLENISFEFRALTMAMVVLGLLGFFSVVFRRSTGIGRAVLGTTLLLFAIVTVKYSTGKFASYELWPRLFSWNLFKAAQYAAPFVTIVALGGLISTALALSKHLAYVVVLPMLICISIGIAIGQDRQTWARGYKTGLDREVIDFLRALPQDGRLLISLQGELHPDRYLVYGMLRERPFLSTEDWQPPSYFLPSPPLLAQVLSTPISYVLADDAGAIEGLPILKQSGRFRLLDARNKEFEHKVNALNGKSIVLIATPTGLRINPL